MARCRCLDAACGCLVVAGDGTTVSGTGTPRDPFVVSALASDVVLQVADTSSVDLSLDGDGTPASPWLLTADSSMAGAITFTDSTEVDFTTSGAGTPGDPMVVSAELPLVEFTGGMAGHVLVQDGTGVFRPAPPPTAVPPGAVLTGFGLTGDGSPLAPMRINLCSYDDLKASCAP